MHLSANHACAPSCRLVSLKEGFIVGGILIGFAAAAVVESLATSEHFSKEDVFRVVWALPLLVSPVVVLGMSVMPPSPRWVRYSLLPCALPL